MAAATGVVTAGKLAYLQPVVQMHNYLHVRTNEGGVRFLPDFSSNQNQKFDRKPQ